MSTLAAHRAAIVATLSGVPEVGRVHPFERYAKRHGDFAALYATGERLLGWHVRRVAGQRLARGLAHVDEWHEWALTGLAAIDDAAASELTFDDLVETVRDAFLADTTLGGAVGSTVDPATGEAGPSVVDSGPVMFAGVLCHRVVLRIVTRTYG
ncbi:hypothetical protein [Roseospirillum parvum]|uniref:Uncharacterized protein n=1 Tax=Roseospirillum parvum TaxID=83401 RepID=A0A1G8EX26_9PROT|nr:hypothetical protein [Roseospirillum parvum]SDH74462.1 hypothetical protein SAMN05421742_11169 [Roseospirillum parvum]